jgi:hypothetical protein
MQQCRSPLSAPLVVEFDQRVGRARRVRPVSFREGSFFFAIRPMSTHQAEYVIPYADDLHAHRDKTPEPLPFGHRFTSPQR